MTAAPDVRPAMAARCSITLARALAAALLQTRFATCKLLLN